MKNNLELLIKSDDIQAKIREHAKKLAQKLNDNKDIVLVAVLNGVSVFLVDLIRAVNDFGFYKINLEFISIKSYVKKKSSDLHIKKWVENDIKNKHIIIIEDVIDSGKTLTKVVKCLKDYNAVKKVDILALVDKETAHPQFKCDYEAIFTIENKFIVGYGFDCDEKYRNLKDICIYKGN